MMMLTLEQQIEEIISASIRHQGYDIVRLLFMGMSSSPTLQIMIERVDGQAITVDDCEQVSHLVSALLDVADPIAEHYDLEVSSPGIERPLTKPEDYKRFEGHLIALKTRIPVGKRKKLKGHIVSADTKAVFIKTYDENIKQEINQELLFSNIIQANLCIEDWTALHPTISDAGKKKPTKKPKQKKKHSF